MPRGAATAATDHAPQGLAKRAEILAAATDLIAAHGIKGMTMRQLAAAAGLNIATLYHYFGSKSDLIGAIVDERHYDAGLRDLALPVDPDLAPRPRLEAVFSQLVNQALGELRLWRLLVGESLRDDAVALAEARRLSGALERAVARWLGDLFPELGSRPGVPDLDATTAVVTGQLLAAFLEEMLLDGADRPARIARRAAATAAVVFPGPD
jgi:AcrR family transcriptional regulator